MMLDDPEMKEMARLELSENEELQPKLEEEIKLLLVPKDPEDDKNVQMEIRAGAGGDEAALFAGDIFNMYKTLLRQERLDTVYHIGFGRNCWRF